MFKKLSWLGTLLTACLFCLCVTPTDLEDQDVDPGTDVNLFSITGSVLNKNGFPIIGAKANLKRYGLSAVTDQNGKYSISGSPTKALSKSSYTLDDTLVDTLLVQVANEYGDSTTITLTEVKSGVIFELPPEYVVQRNISGPISPDDTARIGSIVAYVFDSDAPEQVKTINLWHDKYNQTFNSFAYFTTDTDKDYVLYVKIFDTTGYFLGQSDYYHFTDQTGDIEFVKPIVYNNGAPKITLSYYPKMLYPGDTVNLIVTVRDSFGTVHSCNVVISDVMSNDSTTYILEPDSTSALFIDTISREVYADSVNSWYLVKAYAVNNFRNSSMDSLAYIRVTRNPTISFEVSGTTNNSVFWKSDSTTIGKIGVIRHEIWNTNYYTALKEIFINLTGIGDTTVIDVKYTMNDWRYEDSNSLFIPPKESYYPNDTTITVTRKVVYNRTYGNTANDTVSSTANFRYLHK